jgi:transcription antitermination factor NusG
LLSENGEALPKRAPFENVTGPAGEIQRGWYAAYTMSRHERRIATHCEHIGIEHFLPLYSSRRSWKNRTTVDLQMPLFPNYIFVRLSAEDHGRLLRLPGVLSTVGTSAGPAAISEHDMEALRRIIQYKAIEPHPFIVTGDRVRVKKGPLEGIAGVVLRKINGVRFIVTLDLIGKSVALDIEGNSLELIGLPNTARTADQQVAVA